MQDMGISTGVHKVLYFKIFGVRKKGTKKKEKEKRKNEQTTGEVI